ncbi:enoyl-CoA hydratase [Myxococcota bacterium]|nr:enoyl-CoA hydratase [Myxococcota bacterium]
MSPLPAADSVLQTELDDGVVVVTLDRPDAMNALSLALRRELRRVFRQIANEEEIRVVILTGRGRAFCAGLDLEEMAGADAGAETAPAATLDAADMISALRACPVPIIGAINGFAITGGFELALACDFLIASRDARFADTHARVGIVPGWGLSQLLPRWVGPGRARELSFTGNFLSATQACEWGLVNRVVAPEDLLPTCHQLARDIVSCDSRTIREIKRIYGAGAAVSLGEGLRLEAAAAREFARSVSAADLAARRPGIQARGRSQSR